MDLQTYATSVNIEAENEVSNVTLRGVDLADLLGQINTKEVLEALKANDQYQEIVDFVKDEQDDDR